MPALVALAPAHVAVDPGGDASVEVTIRNTSEVVDHFRVEVVGDASAWATVTPPAVSLFPGTDGTVSIEFRPPRAADVRAGPVDFGVLVSAQDDAGFAVVEEGVLEVAPFTDLAVEVRPRTSEGKKSGRHHVVVENNGNAAVQATVEATDPDEQLLFRISPEEMVVAPGDEAAARVEVRPVKRFARGAERNIPFEVRVRPAGADPVVTQGGFRQKPGMPRWLVPAGVAVIAVAVLAGALVFRGQEESGDSTALTRDAGTGGPTTTAPPAGQEDAGLLPEESTAPTGGAPGLVIPQSPTGGKAPGAAPTGGSGGAAAAGGGATSGGSTAGGAAGGGGGSAGRTVANRKILFDTDRDGPGGRRIYVMEVDGSSPRPVEPGATGDNADPNWSPDGSKIAFVSSRGPGGDFDVWVVNADGSGARQLTTSGSQDVQPRWSPDGTKIAFHRAGAENDIFILDPAGEASVPVRRLTNFQSVGSGCNDANWSPDGSRLAFQCTYELWTADAGASDLVPASPGIKKLTSNGNVLDVQPTWSADGRTIAFTCSRFGPNEICAIDPNAASPDTTVRRLTTMNATSGEATWSADGTKIVFTSSRDGGDFDIFVMNADGSGVANLAGNSVRTDQHAHW